MALGHDGVHGRSAGALPQRRGSTGVGKRQVLPHVDLLEDVVDGRVPGVPGQRLHRDHGRHQDLPGTRPPQLAHAVVEAGRQPRRRAMDLLVAATAHAHGVPLYTRDATDFTALEEHVELRLV